MAPGDQHHGPQPISISGSSSSRRDSNASNNSATVASPESVQAKSTHHAPRKRLLTKLQALVTSPKRAYGHAERDGLGAIAGALTGRHKRDSISKEDGQSQYRERLASDASLGSPASGPRSATSQSSSFHNAVNIHTASNPTSPETGTPRRSPEAPFLTSSPVKRQDKLNSPTTVNALREEQTGRPFDNEKAASETDKGEQIHTAVPNLTIELQPEILLRPHLKLRVVTWNMHDSLPTGDLTELLGAPSSACNPAAAKTRPTPYEPDHAVQPLSSGLDHDAPYHLVVVGGQEVPVGYGGWSGPNWTETIHRWLSGATELPSFGASSQIRDEGSMLFHDHKGHNEVASPSSPNAAHRQLLDGQSSETLILPEDVVECRDDIDVKVTSGLSIPAGRHGAQAHKIQDGQTPQGRTHTSDYLSPIQTSSPVMGRSDSSDTTNTDRSVCTDMKSAVSVEDNANISSGHEQVPEEAQAPYILVTKERLMGIYCSLWVHRSCAHLVQGSSTGTVTAGLLADARLLFVCAHLAAHSEKSALRQANVKKIKEELVIDTFAAEQEVQEKPRLKRGFSMTRPMKDDNKINNALLETVGDDDGTKKRSSRVGQDITDMFEYTFWFGDLNFRLDISRLHADFLIKEKKFDTALTFDQLQPILKDSSGCFGGFVEAPIRFAPSYTYDVLKLKRSRTIQRIGTATSGLGLTTGERRSQTGQFTSPTAPTSLNTSRTNLAVDVVDEEDEEDNHSVADRATLGSSRASISSTYSGFERSLVANDERPDEETLANTHYNHRGSAGFFGTSIPSTPTADKVIEKAKGFFHLMRARSPTNSAVPESATRPSISLDTRDVEPSNLDPNLLSPIGGAVINHKDNGFDMPSYSPRVQTPHADEYPTEGYSHRTGTSEGPLTDDHLRITPNDMHNADRAVNANVVHSTTPILSPRPRLKSMRSSNTVLSMSSIGFGKSVSSAGQEQFSQEAVSQDATYDTSSKKRVQSWTDRILYKSNVATVVEDKDEHIHAQRSLLSGPLMPALRSMSRSVREHQGSQICHRTSPRTAYPEPPQNVNFHTNEATVSGHGQVQVYQRQNSSTPSLPASQPSLPASQPRVNGRLAGLFRRRSSGRRELAQDRSPGQMTPVRERGMERPPTTGRLLSPAVSNLSRSQSTQPSSCQDVAPIPKTPDVTDSEGRRMAPGSDSLPPFSRSKPQRAHTSPFPGRRASGPPDLIRAHDSVVIGRETTWPASPSLMKEAIAPTAELQPHSNRSSHLSSSTGMSRHGSEPLQASTSGAGTSFSRSMSNDQLVPAVTSGTMPSKLPFSLSNPFFRLYYKDEPSQVAEMPNATIDDETGSTKTGIPLLPSKTTPETSDSVQPNERVHLGLRQWWNARMLPHIFTFHSDARTSDLDEPASQEDVAPPEELGSAPLPVIAGPRRGEIQCIYYDSLSDLRRMEACSDHRPVVAVFAIGI